MKQLLRASGVALLLATTSLPAEPIKLLDTSDLTWDTTPEGVAFAALQGGRFAESYQVLVRLPAGTISPPHAKSTNMYGVMLQGEMIHYVTNESPQQVRRIGPGAFYSIASDTAHVSACVSDTPCVADLYQDGAFDFLPVPE